MVIVTLSYVIIIIIIISGLELDVFVVMFGRLQFTHHYTA